MANISTYDGLIQRISNGYGSQQPFWGEHSTTTLTSSFQNQIHRIGDTKALPTLPSGVSAYLITRISGVTSLAFSSLLVAKGINLGSLDISGTSGTFTAGSSMPTITELGASNVTASAVIAEVTTALNSAPGTISFTYTNQAGTTSQTSTTATLTASATIRSGSFMKLNAPDWGAQAITAAARSAGTSPTGVIKFWGFIPIGIIPCNMSTLSSAGSFDNLLTSGFNLPRLGAADTLVVFRVGGSGSSTTFGEIFLIGDST